MKLARLSTALVCAVTASAAPASPLHPVPDTVVIDGIKLLEAKLRLQAGDPVYTSALKHLRGQADSWLNKGPWTVTSKAEAPPNGTLHDYASQAPYFWPNPDTADGCPYVNRDGQRNPEVDRYQDRGNVGRVFNSTYVLALAWYYTGERAYAEHAAAVVRTWFVDPATAMNPNLDHAQIVPCANDGRAIGIIDFSQEYTNVLDAVRLLTSGRAPGWSAADDAAFRDWNSRFLRWLTQSPFGKQEAGQANNHATFANMQVTAVALFVGDRRLARATARRAEGLIDSQITADGGMPDELARTRSWHYVNFNLGAYLRWALVAKKVGVDLYRYRGPHGQSLFGAAGVVVPAAVDGAAVWGHPDLEFQRFAATDNVHAAADAGLRAAKSAVGKLEAPPGGDIFVLRPAPQQLDSIVTL